jgi:nicotinate-nucleotide adenylyltransferase
MLNYLPRWHRAEQLVREVHFVVMARPGFDIGWDELPEQFQHLRGHLVEAPRIDVSATQIRDRVRAGLPIDFLAPPAVVDYIRATALYR